MKTPRPEFENPPVVEVALSVQFEPLAKLRCVQIGSLWSEFKDRFPQTEEHPPLEHVVEKFGLPPARRASVRFELLEEPPAPRVWFLNPEGTELVQIQQDRFVHNWRKQESCAPYPRYKSIRITFEEELRRFESFIIKHGLGDFAPDQCEVTYLNHIPAGELWKSHGELSKIITCLSPAFSDDYLSAPQDITLRQRHVILDGSGQPAGRLHIQANPGFRNRDNLPIFMLELTARGRPLSTGIEGALAFLDLGREWVVRGFASITTPEMHKEWKRQHGD